jgi:hypothetical protein
LETYKYNPLEDFWLWTKQLLPELGRKLQSLPVRLLSHFYNSLLELVTPGQMFDQYEM